MATTVTDTRHRQTTAEVFYERRCKIADQSGSSRVVSLVVSRQNVWRENVHVDALARRRRDVVNSKIQTCGSRPCVLIT